MVEIISVSSSLHNLQIPPDLKKQLSNRRQELIEQRKHQISKASVDTLESTMTQLEQLSGISRELCQESKFSEFIITLFENGRCAVFNKLTHCTVFLNKSVDEQIKSIFYNRINQSVIVVSVTKKDDYNSLKCRSV